MKVINDVRVILLLGTTLLTLLLTGLGMAADTIYMRKSEGHKIVVQLLRGEIKEKKTMLLYEQDEQKKKMIKALIIGYNSEITNIQEAQ